MCIRDSAYCAAAGFFDLIGYSNNTCGFAVDSADNGGFALICKGCNSVSYTHLKYWPAPLWEYDYLTPVVTDGAIIIDGDVTTPAETTPAVTTKATTVSTSDNRNYIDEFKLSAEKVKAEAGADDVVVAVYCDTNEYLIEALAVSYTHLPL